MNKIYLPKPKKDPIHIPPEPEEDPSHIPYELRDSTPKIKFFAFLGAGLILNYLMFFNETTSPIFSAILKSATTPSFIGLTAIILPGVRPTML